MFYKLALSNVKKSIREFIVYFITLAFGVCLFYVFNSIDSQSAMYEVSKSQQELVLSLTQIVGYISVFISIIFAFLILYANNFLIKRRKKEFGIYMTLGMKKSRISRIVIIETLVIGIFSLVVGLVVGIFLSQWLSILTAKMFEVSLKSLQFVFSIGALKKTILYFGIIFFIVMIFNAISISRYKLIDLIYASKKNEKLRFKKLWISVVIFIISVLLLGLAYYRIIHDGLIDLDKNLLITISLGAIGTLLFFLSLAGFLLKVIQSNKRLYFKDLNMFVMRQINSKINTNFISMAIVCLMLFITISALSAGLTIANVYSKDVKESNPYDATITLYNENKNPNLNIDELLKKYNIDLSEVIKEKVEMKQYEVSSVKHLDIFYGIEENKKSSFEYIGPTPVPIVSISDFNNTIKLQGLEPLTLKSDEFYLVCNMKDIKKYCDNFINQNGKLTIDSNTLKSATEKSIDYTLRDDLNKMDIAIIVPDKMVENYIPEEIIYNINYISDDEKYENEFINLFDPDSISENKLQEEFDGNGITRKLAYEASVGIKVIFTYIGVYIGIVFLITSAAILALQQLTEASDNVKRYELLKNIGVENSMLNKAILAQICIYFLVPLSLAIVHSIIGIRVLNDTLTIFGATDLLGNVIMVATLIILIYGGYLIATYFTAKSIIKQK